MEKRLEQIQMIGQSTSKVKKLHAMQKRLEQMQMIGQSASKVKKTSCHGEETGTNADDWTVHLKS
jgi:hypothetical protein